MTAAAGTGQQQQLQRPQQSQAQLQTTMVVSGNGWTPSTSVATEIEQMNSLRDPYGPTRSTAAQQAQMPNAFASHFQCLCNAFTNMNLDAPHQSPGKNIFHQQQDAQFFPATLQQRLLGFSGQFHLFISLWPTVS